MKSLLTKVCCLLLFFTLSHEMATAQTLGRAGGGSGFFNSSPQGGQLAHRQQGTFGNFGFGDRWVGIGQPSVPSGTELYGMRIQDRKFVATFSLNEIGNNVFAKDLDINWGRIPTPNNQIQPVPYDPNLNFRFINGATSNVLRMRLTPGGTLGINTSTPAGGSFKLDVNGLTRCTLGFWSGSDSKYKKDIQGLTNVSEKLAQLEGVKYKIKDEYLKELNPDDFDKRYEIGFIAQDLQKVFPELVIEDEFGFHAVRYEGLIPVLVDAYNEQNETIANQEKVNAEQGELIDEQALTIDALNSKMDRLENQMQQMVAAFNDMENTASLKLTPNLSKETIGTLEQNRPNPFKGITTIAYELPANTSNAQLVVINLEGKQIANYTVNDRQGNIEFDGSNLAAGTYFYSLVVNGENMAQQKMVIQ